MYIYLILPVPSQYRCNICNKQFGTFRQIPVFFFFLQMFTKINQQMKECVNMTWGINCKTKTKNFILNKEPEALVSA